MRVAPIFLGLLALSGAAKAQRERDTLGVAAEVDGGEETRPDGITFAGEARERTELQDNTTILPDARRGDVVAYYRLLGSADLRVGAIRAYAQLGTRLESGLNGPSQPISTDRFDAQQAFVDVTIGVDDHRLRLRGGRQEMAFEFVSIQDSPNVRRSWDGARVTVFCHGWEGDAFALGRVQPRLGAFDDTSRSSDRLDGVHLISPEKAVGPFYLSAYYYDVRQQSVRILPAPAAAHSETWGGALDGAIGIITMRFGGARQTGTFGTRRIDAFSYEAVVGLSFPDKAWKPTIAVRTDGFSGGAPSASRIRTFNPLFPNFAYSTEAGLQSPSNLRKVGIVGTVQPTGRLEIRYREEGLWRYSAADAFYVPGGFAPLAPDGSGGRWIGLQQQLLAQLTISKPLDLTVAYVNFRAGSFIYRAGRTGENFGLLQAQWRF